MSGPYLAEKMMIFWALNQSWLSFITSLFSYWVMRERSFINRSISYRLIKTSAPSIATPNIDRSTLYASRLGVIYEDRDRLCFG